MPVTLPLLRKTSANGEEGNMAEIAVAVQGSSATSANRITAKVRITLSGDTNAREYAVRPLSVAFHSSGNDFFLFGRIMREGNHAAGDGAGGEIQVSIDNNPLPWAPIGFGGPPNIEWARELAKG